MPCYRLRKVFLCLYWTDRSEVIVQTNVWFSTAAVAFGCKVENQLSRFSLNVVLTGEASARASLTAIIVMESEVVSSSSESNEGSLCYRYYLWILRLAFRILEHCLYNCNGIILYFLEVKVKLRLEQ